MRFDIVRYATREIVEYAQGEPAGLKKPDENVLHNYRCMGLDRICYNPPKLVI